MPPKKNMVVSPYSTLFVASQYANPLRSEPQHDPRGLTRPVSTANENPRAAKTEIVRPVLEPEASVRGNAGFAKFSQPENDTLTSSDRPDNFDKVQAFVRIQTFEQTPNLIDTFV